MSDFQTPMPVARYMVSLLPKRVVRVFEPTPGDGNIISALEETGLYLAITFDNFWEHASFRADAVVMNPPFTPMKLGYEILFSIMEYNDIIIALMPWLTIINSEARTQKLLDFGLTSITHLPRSVFPGSRVQTCILELKRYNVVKTEFRYFNPSYLTTPLL